MTEPPLDDHEDFSGEIQFHAALISTYFTREACRRNWLLSNSNKEGKASGPLNVYRSVCAFVWVHLHIHMYI